MIYSRPNYHEIENDVDVSERLLVRRVFLDNEQAATVAEEKFKSRYWAYKWLKIFDKSGLDGLKDLIRNNRSPEVSEDTFTEIKKELSENVAGWRAKVLNIIYENRVPYHEFHMYRLLYKWGFSPIILRKRFVNTASKEEKKAVQKKKG